MKSYELSVIIPTFNRQEYLERCLNGLCNQSQPVDKVIVINDGNQNLDSILNQFENGLPLIIIQTPQLGPTKARNIGLEIVNTDYVAFLDDDSIPDKNWCSACLDMFKKYPMITAQSGKILWAKPIDNPNCWKNFIPRYRQCIYDSRHKIYSDKNFIDRIMKNVRFNQKVELPGIANHFSGNNSVIKMDFIHKHGGFNAEFLTLSDREISYRIMHNGEIIAFNKEMIVYHDHDPSFMRSIKRCIFSIPYEKKLKAMYPDIKFIELKANKTNRSTFLTPLKDLTITQKLYYRFFKFVHWTAFHLFSPNVSDPLAMKKRNPNRINRRV